jgi:hypothetical protein
VVLAINIYRFSEQVFVSCEVGNLFLNICMLHDCFSSSRYETKTPNMAATALLLARDITKQIGESWGRR